MAGSNTMTRSEMLDRIGNGFSVFHQGRILTSPEQVPSDGELEGADGLQKEIEAQAADLAAKKARLADIRKAEREAEKKTGEGK